MDPPQRYGVYSWNTPTNHRGLWKTPGRGAESRASRTRRVICPGFAGNARCGVSRRRRPSGRSIPTSGQPDDRSPVRGVSRRLRRPARRRPVGPRPRCAEPTRRTLASDRAPATRHTPDGDGLGAATRPSSRGSSWETTRDASPPRPWTRCDGTAVYWSTQRPALRGPELRTPHATESQRVVVTAWQGEWTCCVEKGHYGHRSRKTTWWYAVGGALPGSGGGRAQRPVRSRMDTTPQPSGGARSRWRPASASLTVNATPHRSHSALLIAMAGTVKMKSETG